MDLHKLGAQRSLAYHREIAQRLLRDEKILVHARERAKQWLLQTPDRPYVRKWNEVLAGDASSVASFLAQDTELAEELRQSSPFAGVLNARERWQMWRETREAFEAKQ